MTMLDAVEPIDSDVPEVAYMSGAITHERYVELKKKEKYRDGRVQ